MTADESAAIDSCLSRDLFCSEAAVLSLPHTQALLWHYTAVNAHSHIRGTSSEVKRQAVPPVTHLQGLSP